MLIGLRIFFGLYIITIVVYVMTLLWLIKVEVEDYRCKKNKDQKRVKESAE